MRGGKWQVPYYQAHMPCGHVRDAGREMAGDLLASGTGRARTAAVEPHGLQGHVSDAGRARPDDAVSAGSLDPMGHCRHESNHGSWQVTSAPDAEAVQAATGKLFFTSHIQVNPTP